MSSGNKSLGSSSSARGTNKSKSSHGNHGKSDHHHQSKTTDAKHEKGQNKDQSRHAQIIDTRMGGTEDPVLKEQIKQVMDMTRRSEDEVIMALHDSDGDLDRAVNDLLEGVQTEWEVKKKKARQPGGAKANAEQSGDVEETGDWDERRNQRGGGPPRLRGRANHDNRGWRGRENKENERNMEDNVRDGGYGGGRRGGRGGPGRSGRGGRGGGRGLGPRTFANRGDAASSSTSHSFSRPIDTWTGSEEQQQSNQDGPKMDPWNNAEPTEDWDNEYTGSLADTKVFTPSTSMNETTVSGTSCVDDVKQPQEAPIAQSPGQTQPNLVTLQQEESSKLSETSSTLQTQQQANVHQQQTTSLLGISGQQHQQPSIVGGAALTAAQSQYLTQLTQQSSENFKASGQSAFSSITMANQPQRQTKQRPRVPPPSKIPSSAVEMPGDTVNSNIGFLDVQFGALELCSDSGSLDGTATDKYNSSSTSISGIDASSTAAAAAAAVAAAAAANSSTSSNSLDIEAAQQATGTNQCFNTNSQMVSPSNASVAYGTTTSYPTSQKTSYQGSNTAPSSYNAYSSSTGQTGQSSFPTASGGNTNNYATTTSVTQASYNASSSYPQSNASAYNQASPSATGSSPANAAATSAYNQTTTTNQAYPSASSGFVPSTTAQYQTAQSATSNVGVSNSNSNTGGYQASSFQGPSSFQSTPQAYQPSVTTFTSPITQASSGGGGAYQSGTHSVYGGAYGNYNTQQQAVSHNHNKLNSGTTKDSQYESNATTSSGSLATTSAPILGGGGGGLSSSASVNSSQTKSTSSNAVPKSTSSGVVTGAGGTGSMTGGAAGNIAPILNHQYIMGQGMPYATFQQPLYSYEELQILQQRIPPHMPTTGYYDASLGYQASGPATSLGGGRGDGISSVQGVQGVQGLQGVYTSMSDARFARNDSNASPVPSAMSQQTATQHQQPMMNATLPPGYHYITAFGGGILPGSYPYGTAAAIFPQIPTAGNAGTNSGAYNTKPANYGSGYGGGANYDTLASAGPTGEYKGAGSGYTGSQSGKTGTSTGNNNTGGSSGADIGATMYAKSHVALGKVNSYDKQTFHSATPPPFSLTGSQSAGMPSGYGGPHLFISTMPHQMHQPLHQDGGSSSGQRSNASSQNKAQAKPGYSSTYWTAGN